MGIFIQSLTLAAHGLGLGTCLQASLSYYPDAVRKTLNIPDSKKLICGLSLGYPDLDAPLNIYRSARKELKDFATWY
jgi:nitroreductase